MNKIKAVSRIMWRACKAGNAVGANRGTTETRPAYQNKLWAEYHKVGVCLRAGHPLRSLMVQARKFARYAAKLSRHADA